MFEDRSVKCCECGRFISWQDMDAGYAHFHFEPSSHFGPEVCEWTCKSCVDKENAAIQDSEHGFDADTLSYHVNPNL